jgi:two-component system, sensor histidine kinase LadS
MQGFLKKLSQIFLVGLLIGPAGMSAVDAINTNITAEIEYIEDASGTLDFARIQSSPALNWRKIGKPATHFNFSHSTFWLRVSLDKWPDFSAQKSVFTVLEWKALDSVELFYRDKAGIVQRQVAGDLHAKKQWSLPEAHFPAFEISPENIENQTLYIRLFSDSLKNFPIFLKSGRAYLADLKRAVSLIVAYSTLIGVLILFALFLWMLSRDIDYLIYIAYIASISLAFDVTYGNAFDMLWPESTWWQGRAAFTLMGAQVIFSLIFVSRLLDFPRVMPRVDLFSKIVAGLCVVVLPLTLTEIRPEIFSRFYTLIYLLSIPGFFVIAIFQISKSRPHVRLFIIGWAIFFIFVMFHILYFLDVLPYSYFNVYGTIFVLPVDIFFFFMSLWEKHRSSDRERLRQLDEKMQALIVRTPGESKAKYQKSSLNDVDIQSTLARLDILMGEEKIYLIEDLRLPDLAKALGLNRTQISELLNSHFKKNFANFINEYRVKEAQRMLLQSPEQNIIDVAFATGFGSKAAFSTEFKRWTGLPAMEFREKGLKNKGI